MRRLPRIILNAAVAVSTLSCVATVLLWVRSETTRDYAWAWLPWPADAAVGERRLKADVDAGGGQLSVAWKIWSAADRERLRQINPLAGQDTYHKTFGDPPRQYERSSPPTAWNAIGFKWFSGETHSSVHVPYWSLGLVTGCAPGVWLAARGRRRRRRLAGLCPACGYDLRATPERCPECGSIRAR